MISRTTERFRKSLENLPPQIRRQARQAHLLFRENPYHPSLHFKQIHPAKPIYSARVNIDYRVVGLRDGDEIIWFWIGTHSDYDKLISQF
ncbi:MAG: hypothetical protein F9K46_07430 [Anaerolineae bacterium]|nr:MAG: hypothetical protein F9K46_07430 [Anaerolineae bacterium]